MSAEQVHGSDLDNIQIAYSKFLNELTRIVEAPDFNVAKVLETQFGGNESLVAQTADGECVKLGPFNYRPGDSSRKIEIYIQFGVTLRKVSAGEKIGYEITSSSTELVYLRVAEDEHGGEYRKREQGLHFDFNLDPDGGQESEINHPIFHAQYNPNCIDTDAMSRWEPDPHDRTYPDYPRIPSAPFDLVSAVYMILNDHLPDCVQENRGWPQELLHKHLPRFPKEAFKFKPQDERLMTSEWWYLRHSMNEDGNPILRQESYRLTRNSN